MADYSSLYNSGNATKADVASAAIDSAATITENILSVKAFKKQMQASLDEIRAKRVQAVTDALMRKYDEEIAYYEYIESILDELQRDLELMQKRQQRKRLIVYSSCALLTLLAVGVLYSKDR